MYTVTKPLRFCFFLYNGSFLSILHLSYVYFRNVHINLKQFKNFDLQGIHVLQLETT